MNSARQRCSVCQVQWVHPIRFVLQKPPQPQPRSCHCHDHNLTISSSRNSNSNSIIIHHSPFTIHNYHHSPFIIIIIIIVVIIIIIILLPIVIVIAIVIAIAIAPLFFLITQVGVSSFGASACKRSMKISWFELKSGLPVCGSVILELVLTIPNSYPPESKHGTATMRSGDDCLVGHGPSERSMTVPWQFSGASP